MNENDIVDDINAKELVVDTISIVILLYVFSNYARTSFFNQKQKKQGFITQFDDNQTFWDSILVIVVTNLYAYYKFTKNGSSFQDFDRSIDTFL